MNTLFDIQRSKKCGLPEHFIVTKDNTVFLRIIGEQPEYEIMTATADEDGGDIRAYTNRIHIVEVALKTAARLAKSGNFEMPEITPKWKDHRRREYFKICTCNYLSDAHRVSELFFEILYEENVGEAKNELIEIYDQLAIDEPGGDVYLSDGVWLGSDGKITELGR